MDICYLFSCIETLTVEHVFGHGNIDYNQFEDSFRISILGVDGVHLFSRCGISLVVNKLSEPS